MNPTLTAFRGRTLAGLASDPDDFGLKSRVHPKHKTKYRCARIRSPDPLDVLGESSNCVDMEHTEPNPFAEGSRVIITFNPHHSEGSGVVGHVVTFEAGTGFMGCDLAHVEYTLPLDGTTHVLPFGTANLAPGNAERLIALAEKHEAEAARLRGLAGGGLIGSARMTRDATGCRSTTIARRRCARSREEEKSERERTWVGDLPMPPVRSEDPGNADAARAVRGTRVGRPMGKRRTPRRGSGVGIP